MSTTSTTADAAGAGASRGVVWPESYNSADDLPVVEQTPLAERNLPASTYEILVQAAEQWPEKIATTVMVDAEHWDTPVSKTYRELLGEVHRYANTLHSLGVRRNDTVALLSPNCDQLIAATLAAELAGIAAPINGSLSIEHIRHLLTVSGARVLITAGPELDEAIWASARTLADTGAVETVLTLDPTHAAEPAANKATQPAQDARVDAAAGAGSNARFLCLTQAASTLDAHAFVGQPPAADDIASIFHTGGTTGTPKLAAHTHRNEVFDAWSIAANTALDQDASLFAALPLFHVNALIVTLLAPIFRGQRSVWAGPLGYRDFNLYGCFWKLIESYQISTMSAVPTVYAVLATVPVDADISRMKFALVGASALPNGVRTAFEQHTGVNLLEGYGLTEATCASARSFVTDPRPGTVGQRLPYQNLKAVQVDDDGTWIDLPSGQSGNVAINGPAVFAGYVTGRQPDGGLTFDGLGKLRDGWLDTGDLGFVDSEGFLHLTGRAKDLIVRGGHNLDPAVIEEALLSHPDVSAAAAVGMPDAHAGEVPIAYVTLTGSATEDDLKAWATAHVPEAAAAPKAVHIIDAIPVTSVGKIHKVPLRTDAARRAVITVLEQNNLHGQIIDVTVEQTEHGPLVRITATNESLSPDLEGLRTALDSALGAFALRWKLELP
ncbi:MAG: acyl-CoA synthetase [Nocardioides sp.]|uniref:acyl-CoA synthetase n=1 Tax=Nocardioides sp. TaxID=35761 RepID=UPI0039E23743